MTDIRDSIIFKKYSNRRLYNTQKSSYVTLKEVADTVRQGEQIEVFDAKTKEDVTSYILTQIILEEAKNKNTLLPTPLLHLIIQYGDNVLIDFFEKYLRQIIDNYLQYKSTFDEQFKKWMDLGRDFQEIQPRTTSRLNPLRSVFDMLYQAEKHPSKKQAANSAQTADTNIDK